MTNSGGWGPRASRSYEELSGRGRTVAAQVCFLIEGETFCHPAHADGPAQAPRGGVALTSSARVLMTVPSKIRRTICLTGKGYSAHQASQSTFDLRQARVTTSL